MQETKQEQARFEVLPDGWIKDSKTALEWGPSSKESMNLKNAEAYCKEQGGRLPTRTELESILDLEKHDPAVDKEIFKDTKSDYYWSATKTAWRTDCAWCVGFYYGIVFDVLEYIDFYVRPVRPSQCA